MTRPAGAGPKKAGDAALHAAIEAQFRHAIALRAELVEAGAFHLHLVHATDPFYRTVAVPHVRPSRWPPAIAAMRAAFASRGRTPRLEYLEERWPDLAPALEAAGFMPEPVLPVMVKTTALEPPPAAGTVELFSATTPLLRLGAHLVAIHTAFAQPIDAPAMPLEVERLRHAIAAGHSRMAVVADAGERLLSGASLIGISTGVAADDGTPLRVAELAGVWTAADARRRGLARAVSLALVQPFLDRAPGLVWLAASDSAAKALYRQLGFREIGRLRTYTVPAPCGDAPHTPP